MKYLQTDEQTIGDLGLLGKAGRASIYDLFNKTVTQGGSAKLAALFKGPLADEEEINRRSALYRYFSLRELVFPVDSTTVGGVAWYMENDDVRSQLQTGGQSLSQKLRNSIAADAGYTFVEDGVQACLRLFYRLGAFLEKLGTATEATPFGTLYRRLADLWASPAFSAVKPFLSDREEARLNVVALAGLDKQLRFDNREQLLELLDLLYELDVYIAVGQVARQRNFHFAAALPAESNTLDYKQVYHPLVENAIANDLRLDKEHNVLFLTGANMAGKSTLMKSIGVALYLAHMGFPVPAEDFRFSVRDGLYTTINLADNLTKGASHFYAEVLRVLEVAKLLREGRRLLVIFDELFRGTNVKDAHDATVALTRAFAGKSGSQFIISTHIMEAGEDLLQEPLSINYRYLPTEMQGHSPVYTRVLKHGITADRHGMIIIQKEGVLDLLETGLKKNK